MIYIEFIEHDRSVPREIFRYLGDQKSTWIQEAVDPLILQLGRTLRFGPEPSYLSFWEISSFDRLDAWEDFLHSPAAHDNIRGHAIHQAVHMKSAGVYDVLARAPLFDARLFVIEYASATGVDDDRLTRILAERGECQPASELVLLLRRVGALGPDPEILAIWAGARYADFETLFRMKPHSDLELKSQGVYRRFGEEIV